MIYTIAVVGFTLLFSMFGCWSILRRLSRRNPHYENPHQLFRILARHKRLSRRQRKILLQIEGAEDPDFAARLLLDPTPWSEKVTSNPQTRELFQHLFLNQKQSS